MVNVNPGAGSEERDHHTHYLVFREAYKYVQAYWEGHPETDRCWVPWNWCETRKMQRENNSIVIFSPSNLTMQGSRPATTTLPASVASSTETSGTAPKR